MLNKGIHVYDYTVRYFAPVRHGQPALLLSVVSIMCGIMETDFALAAGWFYKLPP